MKKRTVYLLVTRGSDKANPEVRWSAERGCATLPSKKRGDGDSAFLRVIHPLFQASATFYTEKAAKAGAALALGTAAENISFKVLDYREVNFRQSPNKPMVGQVELSA